MAGRYVLLEFEDKDSAQAFVMNNNMSDQLGFGILAMFLKPTSFCNCPDKSRQNVANWKKSRKFGIYVCLRCRKPSIHHQKGILERLKYVFGYNILGE
jgi:hypothetical protein